jgi:hypothetical protein
MVINWVSSGDSYVTSVDGNTYTISKEGSGYRVSLNGSPIGRGDTLLGAKNFAEDSIQRLVSERRRKANKRRQSEVDLQG